MADMTDGGILLPSEGPDYEWLEARIEQLEAERDALLGLLIKEQQQATGRPTYAVRARLTDYFGTYESALAWVRKEAGLT